VIKFFILLWILIKATFTSFAGLASLPAIREDLVEQRHWVTDDQIEQSIVVTRTTPGPVGVYVVAVGYMADGWPGAIAGWIAMSAPSLVVILLVGYFGKRAQHPRVRSMLQCVVLASATLLVLAAIPIGRDALNGPLTIAITVLALPLLISKRINTVWIVAGAAALSFTGSMIGIARLDLPRAQTQIVQHVEPSRAGMSATVRGRDGSKLSSHAVELRR
jgi:chromate transporter